MQKENMGWKRAKENIKDCQWISGKANLKKIMKSSGMGILKINIKGRQGNKSWAHSLKDLKSILRKKTQKI